MMGDKNKFVAVVLSVVPGLSHFYIGLKGRGMIFFILLIVGVIGGIGLSALSGQEAFLFLTIIGYLVLWLIALIDVFSAWRSIEANQMYNNPEMPGITDSARAVLFLFSYAGSRTHVSGISEKRIAYNGHISVFYIFYGMAGDINAFVSSPTHMVLQLL